MTPKEKAEELINSFDSIIYTDQDNWKQQVKSCALRCVDEIIEESSNYLNAGNWMLPSDTQPQSYEDRIIFWSEVKQEIQKL